MRKFQVENIKCQNCANLIINSLSDEFGKIEVDLNQDPRVVSLELDESKITAFKEALSELNFNVIKEL